MGWADCGTNPDTGDEMGYAHEGVCSEPGCETKIDHGLSYLCGEMHMDSETCSRYFCSEHLVGGNFPHQRCRTCAALVPDEEETDDGI